MNIFSRRKRLLSRTPRAPKMSSRRQFHRALRRHPAWPAVMEQAAARARAQGIVPRDRTGLRRFALSVMPFVKGLSPATADSAWRRSKLRRKIRSNRVLIVTLLVVGGLVALLTGLAVAHGEWYPQVQSGGENQLPPGRFGAATTYDGAAQEVVLFGGFVGTTSVSSVGTVAGPPIVTDGSTYVYRDSWQRRDPVPPIPSPRGYAAMAYDGANKNVVLFGGAPYRAPNAAVSGETWIWDGFERDWTLVEPPEPRPDPRQNAVMVYDAHNKVVMMFGGRGADGKPMDDTWTWNGSVWTIMPRAGAPSPRHSAAIAYDQCNAEVVMFGGIGDPVSSFTPQIRETWTWNGDGAKWEEQKPSLSPTPSRVGASMAYSYRSGRVLLYGGLATTDTGQSTAAADMAVWRWDGATDTWEKMIIPYLAPAWNIQLAFAGGDGRVRGAPPPPRAYASFTNLGTGDFGGERGYFNLFGGIPAGEVKTGLPLDNTLLSNVPQAAFSDHFIFSEPGISGNGSVDTDASGGPRVGDTPLTRKCVAPVPLPPEGAGQIDLAAEARNKVTAREGVREVGQLPVLIGTDWPSANRNTHTSAGSNQYPLNPSHTPAPDCPNRSGGETGHNTDLVADQKRNRVYQFFLCDPDRGAGYYQAPGQSQASYQALPRPGRLLIEAYHGATLKPLGRVIVGVSPEQGLAFVHDIEQGRFFQRNLYFNGSIVINELLVLQQDRIEKGVDPIVKKIDLAGAPSFDLKDFFNHPKTGRSKVFFFVQPGGATVGPPPASSTPAKLGQWDLGADPEDEAGREDWRVQIPGCTPASLGLGNPLHWQAMRLGDRALIACHREENKYAVGTVPILVNADGSETPSPPNAFFGGPTALKLAWGDPQTERMLFLSRAGAVVWVFDGKTSRWAGRVGISSNSGTHVGLYFDSKIARLYAQLPDGPGGFTAGRSVYYEQGGFIMVDAGLTPVSQPLKFPQFASFPSDRIGAPRSIAALPPGPGVPRRVFMRRHAGNMKKYPNGETVKMPNEMFYRVLADEVPVPAKLDLSQLDALTLPMAEQPGKTEASFDAEGSGYGIRLRSVGGVQSALRPPAQAASTADVETIALGLIGFTVPTCVFPDRELVAGWVPQARLSDQDAGARSLGLDVDSNSKIDLRGPFSRCNPTANASNFPPSAKPVFEVLWPLWQLVQLQGNEAAGSGTVAFTGPTGAPDGTPTGTATTTVGTLTLGKEQGVTPTVGFTATTSVAWDRHFKEVECVGDALATNTATVGNIYGSANCVQKEGLVEATARGSASGVGPLAEEASKRDFSVGEGYSNVTVAREPIRGVVVTSTAVAKGIALPGITIGYVKTEAVAWSNGRRGVNRAKFTRTICNVNPPLPGPSNFDPRPPNSSPSAPSINPSDYNDSAPNTGCLTPAQQTKMANDFNAKSGVNGKMILPPYDPDLYRGSPEGYIAGVIKPVTDEVEDQMFAKDFQREVAGLVIEFYKDSVSQGPGRQVLQLAAVRAVAGLGVQCNSELVYSSSAKDCLALTFEDDLVTEEFEEEEEGFSEDAELEDADGGWIPVEESLPEPLALGKRIGRFISNLPILRQLPIREIGEALLAFPVWLLLGLPLLLASRRFALNQAHQRGD